jgi:tetratricopeptide (TPR) repeat protein
MVQNYSLPSVRAAIALSSNDPQVAVEALEAARPYETANDTPTSLYPAYRRGLVYLRSNKPREAAAEFQKLIDYPGMIGINVYGALARLHLARAQAMMGDQAAARKSYQDFLTLWKDADLDIPIYKQAKAEYARLQCAWLPGIGVTMEAGGIVTHVHLAAHRLHQQSVPRDEGDSQRSRSATPRRGCA